ncbi:hypothetical protein AC1031_001327 [Aphanomyces cochlioides]|nr:hypothetical protein AC1031_001327 [Aphanomyces cochlioides]
MSTQVPGSMNKNRVEGPHCQRKMTERTVAEAMPSRKPNHSVFSIVFQTSPSKSAALPAQASFGMIERRRLGRPPSISSIQYARRTSHNRETQVMSPRSTSLETSTSKSSPILSVDLAALTSSNSLNDSPDKTPTPSTSPDKACPAPLPSPQRRPHEDPLASITPKDKSPPKTNLVASSTDYLDMLASGFNTAKHNGHHIQPFDTSWGSPNSNAAELCPESKKSQRDLERRKSQEFLHRVACDELSVKYTSQSETMHGVVPDSTTAETKSYASVGTNTENDYDFVVMTKVKASLELIREADRQLIEALESEKNALESAMTAMTIDHAAERANWIASEDNRLQSLDIAQDDYKLERDRLRLECQTQVLRNEALARECCELKCLVAKLKADRAAQ